MAVLFLVGLPMTASATYYTGGDATDQASADDVLDIVFVFDTSTSMQDEISVVNASIQSLITNLDCPDCDVWVRAELMGITQGDVFGENVKDYVLDRSQTPLSQYSEDNGPAATDLVNYYDWNDDSSASQDYYRAIVTIGDEGTFDGYPANQADWDAAYDANQAAIAEGIFVFSVVGTPWPAYSGDQPYRDAVFSAMAIGGVGGGYTFGDTGGNFVSTTTNTIETDIENIICTAGIGGGGNHQVPEPGTILLLGMGLLGLSGFGRGRIRKK